MPNKEGYLLVDHQASPGLPADIARASGYDPLLCTEGKQFEAATLTCAHCKAVVVKSPMRQRARASCPKCSHRYICDVCALRMTMPGYLHAPFEKYIDVTADLAARGLAMPDYNALLFGNPLQTAKPLIVAAPVPPAPAS